MITNKKGGGKAKSRRTKKTFKSRTKKRLLSASENDKMSVVSENDKINSNSTKSTKSTKSNISNNDNDQYKKQENTVVYIINMHGEEKGEPFRTPCEISFSCPQGKIMMANMDKMFHNCTGELVNYDYAKPGDWVTNYEISRHIDKPFKPNERPDMGIYECTNNGLHASRIFDAAKAVSNKYLNEVLKEIMDYHKNNHPHKKIKVVAYICRTQGYSGYPKEFHQLTVEEALIPAFERMNLKVTRKSIKRSKQNSRSRKK